MSAHGLARFDTRQRRTAQTDEYSHQTNLRTHGAREHGQLALNEVEIEADTESRTTAEHRTSTDAETQATENPSRADLEAALECARATIDGLREQVAQFEAEHEQLRGKKETETEPEPEAGR